MRVNIPNFDFNLARSIFDSMEGVAIYFDRDGRTIIELLPTPNDIADMEAGLKLLAENNVPMFGMGYQSKKFVSESIDNSAKTTEEG